LQVGSAIKGWAKTHAQLLAMAMHFETENCMFLETGDKDRDQFAFRTNRLVVDAQHIIWL